MAVQVKNLSCAISFINNTDAVFFTNQTVNGTAALTVLKPLKIRSVSIIITGTAKTKWETGSGRSKTIHKGKEVLLSSTSVLMGVIKGPEIELLAGNYNYNFSCFLPPQLPTTLEDPIGKIRYFVKLLVDRPFKSDDKFVAMFTVLSPLDLNLEPATIKVSYITIEINKKNCILFFFSIHVKLAKIKPFVAGVVPIKDLILLLGYHKQDIFQDKLLMSMPKLQILQV